MNTALSFKIIAECSTTRARVSKLHLPHSIVDMPVFMPVGTQGTMKGLTGEQLKELDCQLILNNTYHLGLHPGETLLRHFGGSHSFMNWNRSLLTDSGGFQMVSLLKLAEITEEGVKFLSPHDGTEMLLTPEKSIELQNTIGADIIMQLDDVVSSLVTGPRVEEAMHRTIRWLDRCLAAHQRSQDQSLFGIVQGGLDLNLRRQCIEGMMKRGLSGYAIGGLSGGECKQSFWRTVSECTKLLPKNSPIYCMGVGYAVDLVICVALGVDMFDCVFPTRTARFGTALVPSGNMNLKHTRYRDDFGPIDEHCSCKTCKSHSKAFLHTIVTKETVACHLLTIHNLHYLLTLMKTMRQSIIEDRFPEFVRDFMKNLYPDGDYPSWTIEALQSVNIIL
jgi:queuine tRNA-ribosyltransferase catalytic subunit